MSLLEESFDEGYYEPEWASTQAPDLDWWAIKVCVREGKHMSLNRAEQAMASKLMRRKGMSYETIANVLRIAESTAAQMTRRDRRGIDLDVVVQDLPAILGSPVPDNAPPLTSVETKRLVGR